MTIEFASSDSCRCKCTHPTTHRLLPKSPQSGPQEINPKLYILYVWKVKMCNLRMRVYTCFFYLLCFAFVPFFGFAKSRRTGGKIFDCYVNVVAVAKGGRFVFSSPLAYCKCKFLLCCLLPLWRISDFVCLKVAWLK